MCSPIRTLTKGRGYDTSKYCLACFGGAGGQHACSIAEGLGIRRVIMQKYSSILSAYGIGLAEVVHEEQLPSANTFDLESSVIIAADLNILPEKAGKISKKGGFNSLVEYQRFLGMRYDGSVVCLMITDPKIDSREHFIENHFREFGFNLTNRPILVNELRVRAIGRSSISKDNLVIDELKSISETILPPKTTDIQSAYFTQLGC